MKQILCRNMRFMLLCALFAPAAHADVQPSDGGGCDMGCVTANADVSNYGLAGTFAGIALAGGYLLRRRR